MEEHKMAEVSYRHAEMRYRKPFRDLMLCIEEEVTGMIKVRIFNARAFLDVVNHCKSAVYLIRENGGKVNLCHNPSLQEQLNHAKSPLKLSLEIPNPSDYMDIVLFTTGEE